MAKGGRIRYELRQRLPARGRIASTVSTVIWDYRELLIRKNDR
jgi:hypothetical protein